MSNNCPRCNWAGDEWTIQTISKLYTQIEELQEHIKELVGEAVDDVICVQESERSIDVTPKNQAMHSEPFAKDSPLIFQKAKK